MAASNMWQTFRILLVEQSNNHFHQEYFAMTPSVDFSIHQIPSCISVKYIDMLPGAKNTLLIRLFNFLPNYRLDGSKERDRQKDRERERDTLLKHTDAHIHDIHSRLIQKFCILTAHIMK